MVRLFGVDRGNRNLVTYYSILGVKQTASADQIRVTFRKLMREVHPDANQQAGEGGGDSEYQKIVEAYKVLSSDELRKAYDRQLGSPLEQLLGLSVNLVRLSADLLVDVAVPFVRDVAVPAAKLAVPLAQKSLADAARNQSVSGVLTTSAGALKSGYAVTVKLAQGAPKVARAVAESVREEMAAEFGPQSGDQKMTTQKSTRSPLARASSESTAGVSSPTTPSISAPYAPVVGEGSSDNLPNQQVQALSSVFFEEYDRVSHSTSPAERLQNPDDLEFIHDYENFLATEKTAYTQG